MMLAEKLEGAVYLPCKAGEWEIQAAYQALTDKIKVKVVVGELSRLEISPYAKPFKIQEDKSQVFTVKGFDTDNNKVTILDPEWSTTGEKVAIGKIDKNGKFIATHGGIGRITAEAGELSASVGIIVKEVKAAVPVKKKTTAAPTTTGTGGTRNAEKSQSEKLVNRRKILRKRRAGSFLWKKQNRPKTVRAVAQ